MHRYANPTRFLRLSGVLLPWAAGLALVLFAAGLWLALVASPEDYQQGATVRIMYIHVPSAWMALFAYATMAVGLDRRAGLAPPAGGALHQGG